MTSPVTLDDIIRAAAPAEAWAAVVAGRERFAGYDARRAAVTADYRARYGDRAITPTAHATRAAEPNRGELLRPKRGTRRERAVSAAVREAYRRRLVDMGQHDAAPRCLPPDAWATGERAMRGDWRATVLELPPLVALAVSRAGQATQRQVHAMLVDDAARLASSTHAPTAEAGRARLARLEAAEPTDALAWDFRRGAARKVLAVLAVLVGLGERTERPGFSHVVAGYGVGELATCVPNATPYAWRRGTGARPAPGDAAARYGFEAMTCADTDAAGIPRGVLPVLRLWARHFGLGLESHQPHGGAPGLAPYERGPDGRWAFAQYWFRRSATLARFVPAPKTSKRRRAVRRAERSRERRPGYVHAPEVLAWVGRKVSPDDVAGWVSFEAWRAREAGDDAAALAAREQLGTMKGEQFAALEGIALRELSAAESAALAGDALAARVHLERARRAGSEAWFIRRTMNGWFGPADARRFRDVALERAGILEASRALAQGARPPPPS